MVSGAHTEGKKHLSSSVQLDSLFWVFFLSQGAEGEMVFPTEETPFKSDNTTELFNSGQPLPLLCTGASVTDLRRVVAGWRGGFRVQPRDSVLVSRPKPPKPLPCAVVMLPNPCAPTALVQHSPALGFRG